MQIRHGLPGLRSLPPAAVLSIGNYDGIHLGHRRLLELAATMRAKSGGRLAVVTFEPHPLTVLKPELAPPRLTPPAIKQALLQAAGVDDYVILPPAPEVLNLTAEQFWQILRDEVRPRHLIEGSSFNFGKGRGGNIDRLREWTSGGGASHIELDVVDPVSAVLLDLSVVPVSSSLIRWLLAHGRVRDAAICLGRAYAIRGKVIQGFGRGRQLGIPTANLQCDDQLIPADGVYAARCSIDGVPFAAAVSIGSLPTFEQRQFQVEAHLIDFTPAGSNQGELYDKTIEIELTDWVREQRKFAGVAELMEQIARDLSFIRGRCDLQPQRSIAAA
jgi:riboflavin kinase/FMN adenylyltransferase